MKVRGTIGGHRLTRIYGRLDCPSALRAIAKGGYVTHRVFFADEATAVAAGYRPCARCLPVQYREWKANASGGGSSAQNDHIVHPRDHLSVGTDDVPLDGIDTHTVEFVGTQI